MSERPGWRLSREATRFALIISWPFTALGSLLLSLPPRGGSPSDWWEAYEWIEAIYFAFGYPLTYTAFVFRPRGVIEPADYWWALPLLNFLFFAQWMIWTQLLALGWRALEWLCRRLDEKLPAGWE